MKVKMLVSITGTIDGKPWPVRGGEIELPDHVAADLIANGYAETSATGEARTIKVETASVDPVVETASKPAAKARKKPVED